MNYELKAGSCTEPYPVLIKGILNGCLSAVTSVVLFFLLCTMLSGSFAFAQSPNAAIQGTNIDATQAYNQKFSADAKSVATLTTYSGLSPQRLSEWLLTRERSGLAKDNEYLLGLSWMTPEELAVQQQEYAQLQEKLEHLKNFKSWRYEVTSRLSQSAVDEYKAQQKSVEKTYAKLKAILDQLKPTGKVRTAAANAKWLEVNPKKDPILRAGDKVLIPFRPTTVLVMSARGVSCEAPHKAGLHAQDYVKACQTELSGPWAWVVQPDGHVAKVGLSLWNPALNEEPAPGAWIWAPDWSSQIPESFSESWAEWLATQSVSTRISAEAYPEFIRQVQPEEPPTKTWNSQNFTPLNAPSHFLEMPSARMNSAGSFSTSLFSTWPYVDWVNVFQPFDWLETEFGYTKIENRFYSGDSGQGYMDKHVSAKARVFSESDFVPEVAVGISDMAGTGLFGSEYVVASKRIGRLDFSAGIAFGNMGARGTIKNPLGGSFDTRPVGAGGAQGGQLSSAAWFHGPGAPIGSVEYTTPWNLLLKAELDGNNYKAEPLGNVFAVKSPVNVGMVYQPNRNLDLTLGFERGNTLTLGLTLYTDLSSLTMPKLSDPPGPPITLARPAVEPDWSQTARDIQEKTMWKVQQIYESDHTVSIVATDSYAPYPKQRVDTVMGIVNRDAPQSIDEVKILHKNADAVLATETLDRDKWVLSQTAPARTATPPEPGYISYDLLSGDLGKPQLNSDIATKFRLTPGLDFIETLQGPTTFLLYQFSAALWLEADLPGNFKLKGLERARLFNNYDLFQIPPASNLPHVRSEIQNYYTTSEFTMANLSLTNTRRVSESWYASAYAGYFEEMFGGVGGEVMYRPVKSQWATSLNVNRAFQRSFAQDFNFQDYRVTTGHVTEHWQTPFEGVELSIAAGQYLAGDKGATYTMSKSFHNGVSLSAYFSRTNVPAAVFGEGSFDKGILISIPFDSFMTRSSPFTGYFLWTPLVKDGGQMLHRPVDLYRDDTRWVSPDAMSYTPALAPNEELIPDEQVAPQNRLH